MSKAAQGEVLVQLHKASQHEKLGLGLIENASGQVVVSYIHPGYVADKCKALLSADVLLEVNGEPVADLATALKLLNASLGTVELRLVRMDTACALNCAAHYMCMCMSCACAMCMHRYTAHIPGTPRDRAGATSPCSSCGGSTAA